MPRLATIPQFDISLRLSDGFYELVKGSRLWNVYARNALGDELLKHYRTRIPLHFRLGAHEKYGYAPRKSITKKRKVRYWKKPADLDQVRSGGQSKFLLSNHRLAFSGSFGTEGSGGVLRGRLIMNRPRRLYPASGSGITPEQLDAEITSTTAAERQEIAEGYRDRLVRQINGYHGPMRKTQGGGPASHRRFGNLRSPI
jgi:hypothetical protein